MKEQVREVETMACSWNTMGLDIINLLNLLVPFAPLDSQNLFSSRECGKAFTKLRHDSVMVA